MATTESSDSQVDRKPRWGVRVWRSLWLPTCLLASGLYLVYILALPFCPGTLLPWFLEGLGLPQAPMRHWNEWGDYLTGFLSPLALVWFVGTLYLQRYELQAQREELQLTRKEIHDGKEIAEDQARAQHRWAEATEQSILIQKRIAFFELSARIKSELVRQLRDYVDLAPPAIPDLRDQELHFNLDPERPQTVNKQLQIFAQWKGLEGLPAKPLETYMEIFRLWKQEAENAGCKDLLWGDSFWRLGHLIENYWPRGLEEAAYEHDHSEDIDAEQRDSVLEARRAEAQQEMEARRINYLRAQETKPKSGA